MHEEICAIVLYFIIITDVGWSYIYSMSHQQVLVMLTLLLLFVKYKLLHLILDSHYCLGGYGPWDIK